MRTSRIQGITSSVFRNSRQYLQTNERVFRLLDEGEEKREKSTQHQNGKEKQGNAPQKTDAPMRLIRNNRKAIFVKGVQSDANSMAELHNYLLKKTSKIKHVSKKSQISTYRSSI
ncbi:hypothetical protein [Ureibacillus acetophenoni]|uniref:Uncharacterized protein n=1 Tax=Ureibacillus acetophenoni TaxID=614649 RepID=A0A285UNH6_9BACL|nr:hypothetical protein [Ureibacillus acetophenoni]SOC43444.1 hypothetical protein SAMN05877842_11615 [Ureibacillus acetophenoni]